jgi:tRNA dimethylallyltransferase
MIDLICIFGATSSGKSDVAVAVAKELGGEVISADSMQVYQGLDIGTGKVTREEMAGIPHYLLDICHPSENYSAGDFQRDTDQLIEKIRNNKKVPIVAGGTGLYFRALLQGLAPTGKSDPELRDRLRKRQDRVGTPRMHSLLRRLDPEIALKISENDTQRVLRALEYRVGTSKRLSEEIAMQPFKEERYQALKIGLKVERPVLRERISRRVDKMIAAGWLEEVEKLLEAGVPADSHALSAIGYRELLKYTRKEVSLGEAIELIKIATHQYAKRQDTWFRKEKDVTWFEAVDLEITKQEVIKFINGKK